MSGRTPPRRIALPGPRKWSATHLQMWSSVRYKSGAGVLAVNSFLFHFLANVKWTHVHVRYNAIARPCVCLSVVCNARAHYSGGSNFQQYFYGIWYLGHPWHPHKISRRSSQGTPQPWQLNTRGVVKYSDFGPIEGYISKTVQDRR